MGCPRENRVPQFITINEHAWNIGLHLVESKNSNLVNNHLFLEREKKYNYILIN